MPNVICDVVTIAAINLNSHARYDDVQMDLDYFQSRNIKDVKILEIKENETECFLYIEFITNFF